MPKSDAAAAPQPMAGGQPIGAATAEQAADWLTLFMSGEATEADRQRWQQWCAADPEHQRAWRHIESVTGKLKILEPKAAYQTLSAYADAGGPPSNGRRKLLGIALCGGMAGTTGLLASRPTAWQVLAADYRTGTGERRDVVLDDGTRITLNTGSAIDVRFDAQRRSVRLLAGELAVVTGHPAGERRDFVVETAQGSIRALGTRFTVRQLDGRTRVVVLESAVEIAPRQAGSAKRVLHAGEQTSFAPASVAPGGAADAWTLAWTRGQLVAADMRLDDFVAELGRYRPGLLRCEDSVAHLRLSGVFPLDDTGRILATLPDVLPVRVHSRSPYWIVVAPR